MCQVYLMQKNYSKVLKFGTEALEYDSENKKLRYKVCFSHLKL